MKSWNVFLKALILIICVIAIGFDVFLFNLFVKQRIQTENVNKQMQVEAQVSSNKFKYQQEQTERISKDLESSLQLIKDQNDALSQQKDSLLQEVEKRQEVENMSKSVQLSLVDIKAEADAIKQEVKGWQKDYVAVLAELEKKMDDSQGEIKSIKNNLDSINIPELKRNIGSLKDSIEKLTRMPDNSITSTPTVTDNKIKSPQAGS